MSIIRRISSFIRTYSFNSYLSSLLFFFLTLVGLARAFQQYYIIDAPKLHQYSLWWHVPFNLFIWWLWLLFVPLIYWITVTFKTDPQRKLAGVVIYFLLPILIISLRHMIAAGIVQMVIGSSTYFNTLTGRIFRSFGIWVDFVVYFSIMIGVRIIEYQQKEEKDRLKYTQLQARLTQLQLNALKSQLRPHFLFNTLNSLSTYILLNENEEAMRMLQLIKNFLKTTIDESVEQEIPLEKELQFIGQYLEIQKVRYEEKLNVVRDIAPETLQAAIPSFLLLPLVENCIYHAIAPKVGKGIVRISAHRVAGDVVLCVEDNGPGLHGAAKAKKATEGVGIKITRERLFALYKENQSFRFEASPLGGLKVNIRFPYHRVVEEPFPARRQDPTVLHAIPAL